MRAVEEWVSRVEAYRAQSRRIQEQSGWIPDEGSMSVANMSIIDPGRTDDPVPDRLLRALTAESPVLDVGGGAGRHALPGQSHLTQPARAWGK
jgi:hypothetical protein